MNRTHGPRLFHRRDHSAGAAKFTVPHAASSSSPAPHRRCRRLPAAILYSRGHHGPRTTADGGPRMATAPRPHLLSPTWRTSRFRLVLRPRMPSRAQTPGSAAPVRRTATCWCSGAGDAPPPRRGARSDLDRRAASWAHGGLDGFNGTWGSRQSGCCSISDGTVARVGICCYWKRHEMEGPTDLGEWSLDSILTWLIV